MAGRFLVVEDELRVGQGISRLAGRFRATDHVKMVSEAVAALESTPSWTGLIVDIGLPDGSGLEVIEFARRRFPLLPVLVLTGRFDRVSINRAYGLRAEYVCKPAPEQDILSFLRRAMTFERVSDERMVALVDELCRACSLSPREVDLVGATLASTPRRQLLDQFQITENTLKSQVRQLLRKTGHDSLDGLTKSVLRDALAGSDAVRPVGG